MRKPVQKRSRERYEKILAAASALMSDRRLEEITVREVAAAADVPVGTLYQFFGDKDGLFEALADRFKAEVNRFAEHELTAERAGSSLEGFIDRLVDGIEAIQNDNDGFICLARTDSTAGRAGALAGDLRATLANHLSVVIAEAYPNVAAAERALFLEILSSTMISAFARTPPHGSKRRKPYLDEVKRMLAAYSAKALRGMA